MGAYISTKFLMLTSRIAVTTVISMITMFILLMASLSKAESLKVESTTENSDYRVVVNLSDAIDLVQSEHVILTDIGSLKSEINIGLSKLEFEQRDSDLVIDMPFDATFEQRYIEGGQSQLLTHNQILTRNNGQVYGDVSVVNGRDVATTALYFANNGIDSSAHSYIYSPMSGLNLLQVRQSGYSYSAWIKPSSLTGLQSIAASGPYHTLSNWLYLTDDKIAFQYRSDQGSGASVIGHTALQPDQ